MTEMLRITILIFGSAFFVLSVYLLVKKRINERSTILWLMGAIFILVLAAVPQSLNYLARWAGVDYPPALLFLVSTLILFTVVLYQSIQISVIQEKTKELGQAIALLQYIQPSEPLKVFHSASDHPQEEGSPER